MCFAELVVGFIDEGSDIVGVFYLELIPLQNLVATFEGYRVRHTLPRSASRALVYNIEAAGATAVKIQTETLVRQEAGGADFD